VLATVRYAEGHLRSKYGQSCDALREVLQLAEDLHAVIEAATRRERSMRGIGRHRLARLQAEDLPVRLPGDGALVAALVPLAQPLLVLREQILEHDRTGGVAVPVVRLSRFNTTARRLEACLLVAACEALKLPPPDEYDLVALAVRAGAGPEGETTRTNRVKSRLDRWRYGLQGAWRAHRDLVATAQRVAARA
jgi:hypothetical protein